MGLVNKVVPLEQLQTAAWEWAKALVAQPPLALAQAKALINQAWGTTTSIGIQNEVEAWAKIYETKDQKEGMEAFLEKRKPNFIGE